MFLVNKIAHQRHITREWIRLLVLYHGSFESTILLYILNDVTCQIWFPIVRYDLMRWFLRFHHIMILRYNIIRSNYNFLVRFCKSVSYKFFFIDLFQLKFPQSIEIFIFIKDNISIDLNLTVIWDVDFEGLGYLTVSNKYSFVFGRI
jgi:hypothetical protein